PAALLGNDTDPENDTLSIESVSNPSNGTVELDADGNVIFTPESGFTGDATFEYTINDGNGGTDTATVTV
ncbi:Ig-like domain-containing protein, partial [Lyngbya sp. CCY1209]|uniref:Ig-like domain-containing protein n=1 Tax=Lyngbya sp. CCY1209 TaxID=2886103 RepID=UPI002D2057B6